MPVRLRYLVHDLEVPPGEFVIGRSPDCQLSLDDPLVSRRHAILVVQADAVYVEDLASRNGVLVNGKRVPLVGRVSMDMITVDLRTQPDARVGDPVVLWGEGLPVEEITESAGTISYDLLCRITRRVPVIVKE